MYIKVFKFIYVLGKYYPIEAIWWLYFEKIANEHIPALREVDHWESHDAQLLSPILPSNAFFCGDAIDSSLAYW